MSDSLDFFVEYKKDNKWFTADNWETRHKDIFFKTSKFYDNYFSVELELLGCNTCLDDEHIEQIVTVDYYDGLPHGMCLELQTYFPPRDYYDLHYVYLIDLIEYPWDFVYFDKTIREVCFELLETIEKMKSFANEQNISYDDVRAIYGKF